MTVPPSNSKDTTTVVVEGAEGSSPPLKDIPCRAHVFFDATGGDETTRDGPDTMSTAQAKYDKLAVDIVAVYAGEIAIFEKQLNPQKPAKGSISDPVESKPSHPQRTDAPQSKPSKTSDAPQSKKVNWLTDKNMMRNHLPVARIIGFALDLASPIARPQTDSSPRRLASIAYGIGNQLQNLRTQCAASRPVVFLGHGYGCLLIESLLNPDQVAGALAKFTADLRESTAAIGFFGLPLSIAPLIDWSSRHFGISREAKVFSSLQMPVTPEVWHAFTRRKQAWYALSFAFLVKVDGGKERGEDDAPPADWRIDTVESEAAEKSTSSPPLADKIWESEEDFGDIAKVSGPRDQKFRAMADYLTRAIHTHHLLSAAKRGDDQMITHLAELHIDLNLVSRQGETALHVAVQNDRLDTVRALIRTGKAVLDQQSESGSTALHFAVVHNGSSVYGIVKELLEAGASPNLRGGEDGETPTKLADRLMSESPPIKPTAGGGKESEDFQSRRRMTKDLLDNPPPVAPPRVMRRLVKETPDETRSLGALDACRKTVAVVREMFWGGSYIPYYVNIEQLLYGKSSDDEKPTDQGRDEQEPDDQQQEDKGLKASLDRYFQKHIGRQESGGNASVADKYLMCRWYHIPMNNMAWVHDLFATLDIHVWPWPKGFRSFTLPYSRTVYPQVAKLKQLGTDTTELTVWAIMMPYVSYEDYDRQTSINDLIRKLGRQYRGEEDDWRRRRRRFRLRSKRRLKWFWRLAGVSSHDWERSFGKYRRRRRTSSEDNSGTCEAIKAYLHYKHASEYERDLPLHPRRTLDQSYYYMLNDTSFRDKTQVVSRWILRSNRRRFVYMGRYMRLQEGEAHNILMVDQLWLWLIQRKGEPDVVISSFPNRKGTTPSAVDDLQKQILEDGNRHTTHLLAHILAVCCTTLSPNQDVESVKFLQFFENSVAHVEERSSHLFQEFRLLSIVLHGLDNDGPQYKKRRRILLEEFLDISKESKPLAEVKDILDEIKMIQTILEDQKSVLNSSEMEQLESHVGGSVWEARSMIDEASRGFGILKTRAEDVEKSIEHLLDLKQKQANLWEARTSREGADETSKQGNTLLVFTVVTIIFLPLSFMASFFALDISSFPQDEKGQTDWPLSFVCRLLFGISFAVSIPFILIAFLVEYLKTGWLRLRFFLRVLLLPLLHLLSRLPYLDDMGDIWWNKASMSAKELNPGYEDNLKMLLRGDNLDDIGLDEDISSLFDKRLERFRKSGRLGGMQEDSEDSDEDMSDC